MTQAERCDKYVLAWSASVRLHVLNVRIWLQSFDNLCRRGFGAELNTSNVGIKTKQRCETEA